eukprot:3531741-Rhodomonas_salina.6
MLLPARGCYVRRMGGCQTHCPVRVLRFLHFKSNLHLKSSTRKTQADFDLQQNVLVCDFRAQLIRPSVLTTTYMALASSTRQRASGWSFRADKRVCGGSRTQFEPNHHHTALKELWEVLKTGLLYCAAAPSDKQY